MTVTSLPAGPPPRAARSHAMQPALSGVWAALLRAAFATYGVAWFACFFVYLDVGAGLVFMAPFALYPNPLVGLGLELLGIWLCAICLVVVCVGRLRWPDFFLDTAIDGACVVADAPTGRWVRVLTVCWPPVAWLSVVGGLVVAPLLGVAASVFALEDDNAGGIFGWALLAALMFSTFVLLIDGTCNRVALFGQ